MPWKDIRLKYEFRERGPWVTKFLVDGKAYGGTYDATNDIRVEWLFQYFPNAQNILELGSLEGDHTFALAKHPEVKSILALEGR